jgi:hypothetical protein
MTNNSACWYLFPGAKTRRRPWPHNRLRFFLKPTTATDTHGLGIDVYNLPWIRVVWVLLRKWNSHYGACILLPRTEDMADPDRGGAWHLLSSARRFWYGSKRVATMGAGLACACPRLSLRSHAPCVWLVWSAVCLPVPVGSTQ